jgi:hypothetical protein
MVTVKQRPPHSRVLSRLHFGFLQRAAIGVAVALVGLMAATGPAFAAPSTDGTSNTIQFAVTSAVLDQAHQRVVVAAPAARGLAGKQLALVEVVTPQLTITLENTLVSGLVGQSSESLSLNYTKIQSKTLGVAACAPGVDACLIEDDGIWLPGG